MLREIFAAHHAQDDIHAISAEPLRRTRNPVSSESQAHNTVDNSPHDNRTHFTALRLPQVSAIA